MFRPLPLLLALAALAVTAPASRAQNAAARFDARWAAGDTAGARAVLDSLGGTRSREASVLARRALVAWRADRNGVRAFDLARRALDADADEPVALRLRLELEQAGVAQGGTPPALRAQQRASTARRLLRVDSTSGLAHAEVGRQALEDFLFTEDRFRLRYLLAPRPAEDDGGSTEPDWFLAADPGAFGPDGVSPQALRNQGALAAADERAVGLARTARRHLLRALATPDGFPYAYEAAARLFATTNDPDLLLRVGRAMEARRVEPVRGLLLQAAALYRLDRVAEAERTFAEAARRLPPDERAAYTDLRPVLSPDSLDVYLRDRASAEAAFWSAADPRRLTPENERRAEHVARVVEADLLFTTAEARGRDTAPGRVYVRFGAPSDRITIPAFLEGLGVEDLRPGVSQRRMPEGYAYRSMVVWEYGTFTLTFGLTYTGQWDLYAPRPEAFQGETLAQRKQGLTTGSEARYLRNRGAEMAVRMDNVIKERQIVRETPERSTFDPAGRARMPVETLRFRDAAGWPELVVTFAVPLPGLRADRPVTVPVQSDVALFVGNDRAVAEQRRRFDRLPPEALVAHGDTTFWAAGEVVRAAPGRYTLHVEHDAAFGRSFGFERGPLRVDAPGRGLAVSDLLLAHRDTTDAAALPGAVVRGTHAFVPAARAAFARAAPVHLYFEAYALGRGADGRTRYDVETAVLPERQRSLLRQVFGRPTAGGVTTGFEAGGTAPDATHAIRLDLARLQPGRYVLGVRVRDRVSGAETVRERTITLR